MFDYQYDYEDYYEPSEIEEELIKFKEGIHRLINKDIALRIESQGSTIVSLKAEIERLKKTNSELRKESREAIEKGKQEQIDKIIGKYKKGDAVYIIKSFREKHECEDCDKGKLKIVKNSKTKEIKCPTCNGKGEKSKRVTKVSEAVISRIDISVKHSNYGNCAIGHRYYYVDTSNDHKNIYGTKEEAEKNLR